MKIAITYQMPLSPIYDKLCEIRNVFEESFNTILSKKKYYDNELFDNFHLIVMIRFYEKKHFILVPNAFEDKVKYSKKENCFTVWNNIELDNIINYNENELEELIFKIFIKSLNKFQEKKIKGFNINEFIFDINRLKS